MNQALLANTAAVAQTDATGRATFPGVPPGTYDLMVSGRYNNQALNWNLKFDLKAGANSITLDEHNPKPSSAGATAALP